MVGRDIFRRNGCRHSDPGHDQLMALNLDHYGTQSRSGNQVELVKEVSPNSIIATGRSDYPNQVNNVLVSFMFRGERSTLARQPSTTNERRAHALGCAC